MARNGSGTYSVPTTFTPSTTISSTNVNSNFSDIGTEITNSVAADGQTTMTGTLKAANGTVALPGLTFGSDTDLGIYRIGANNLGIACGSSTKVLDVASTGLAVTGTLSSSGALTTTSGGHTITAGGLTVTAGNVAITAGDFAIATNKFTVANASGNTVVAGTLAVTGAATLASVAGSVVATQSDQETSTSTTTIVTPGRQQFHPSASKCWLKADFAGGTDASYNITSVTDGGTGSVVVTIATDFASANWAGTATPIKAGGLAYAANIDTQQSGQVALFTFITSPAAAADAENVLFVGFGDI